LEGKEGRKALGGKPFFKKPLFGPTKFPRKELGGKRKGFNPLFQNFLREIFGGGWLEIAGLLPNFQGYFLPGWFPKN